MPRARFLALVGSLVCLPFASVRAEKADTTVVRQFAELLGNGSYARIAWSKGDSNVWLNLEVPERPYSTQIYVCDTKDGRRRPLTAPQPSGHLVNVSFTADGSRLTFCNGIAREVYVCDFRGTNLRKIFTGGISFGTWRDPITNSDWVIVNDAARTWRVNVDTPSVKVPLISKPYFYYDIYTQDSVGMFTTKIAYATLSPDGSRLAAGFPFFSNIGVMTVPDGATRKFTPNGCWSSYSRTSNNKILYTIQPHTNVRIVDTLGNEVLNKNIAAGINGAPVLPGRTGGYYNALRWSNDDDVISHWNGGLAVTRSGVMPVVQRISTTQWVSLYDSAADFNANTDVFVYTGTIADTSNARLDTSKVDNTGTNLPPRVSAGPDTTFTLSPTEIFTLHCGIEDDGKRLREPQASWSMLSGPAVDTIISPQTQHTSVLFTTTGTYRFRVQVYDGEFTVADTVAVTVEQGRPLTITAPVAGERITIGSTDTVKWDIAPPQGMTVHLTTDDGLTWQELTTQAVGVLPPLHFIWQVSEDLTPSNTCRIKVSSYVLQDDLMAESGTFSLVTGSGVSGPRLSTGFSRGGVRLRGVPYRLFPGANVRDGILTIRDAAGRAVARLTVVRGVACALDRAFTPGTYVAELRTGAGKVHRCRFAWTR